MLPNRTYVGMPVCVLFGPRNEKSRDAGLLITAGGGAEISEVADLSLRLAEWLGSVPARDAAGTAARATVGQRVGLTPKNSGSAWLSYQATPKLRIAGGLNGASENFALQGTSGAAQLTARAAGYVVVDAMMEYKVTPDTYVQLNVANLANKIYGDQLYPAFAVFGAPRTVKLTVGTRF